MSTVHYIPPGFHAITPYLTVNDAPAAIRFYQAIFGAREIGRITMPGGVIGHAELQIDDARLMLAEEMPQWGSGASVGIALYVAEVDGVFQRALDAGAITVEPVRDQLWGARSGTLQDPFGHRWHILTHREAVSFPEIQRRFEALGAGQP